ncbi:MAG: type II toxin-antitoxin system YafQ family toxin [Oscillospiraceae bacterium]|nr:type II toxin-antitoxin system YafQ family toxin [Oscillospiraceae bacterium]
MLLSIKYTNKMKRDVKRMSKRGKDISKLTIVLNILLVDRQLPENYRDHPLRGDMTGYRECHIEPDWLLIYRIIEDELVLVASGTGTHADLFNQ